MSGRRIYFHLLRSIRVKKERAKWRGTFFILTTLPSSEPNGNRGQMLLWGAIRDIARRNEGFGWPIRRRMLWLDNKPLIPAWYFASLTDDRVCEMRIPFFAGKPSWADIWKEIVVCSQLSERKMRELGRNEESILEHLEWYHSDSRVREHQWNTHVKRFLRKKGLNVLQIRVNLTNFTSFFYVCLGICVS